MFQGIGRKDCDCSRCMMRDARRRVLNGEGYKQVQFGEIDANSRASSPGAYGNKLNNYTNKKVFACHIQQENKSPQPNQLLEDHKWRDANHKAYRMKQKEHSLEKMPSRLTALEEKGFGRGKYRTRRASPKGEIWTPDTMRGLETNSPFQTGGRNVLTPSQRSADKWNEEHLSLRFSDAPQTECTTFMHHHGIEPPPPPQPDPDQKLLEHLLSSFPSKEYLEAEESSHTRNGDRWWGKSKEEHSCKRCLSHHRNYEGVLNLNEELKRINKQISTLRAQIGERTTSRQRRMALKGSARGSRHSTPEFSTPPEEFARSRTPTPQRSHSYRDLYERKIQARSYFNKSPNFEPSKKMPRYDIAEYIGQCRVPMQQRKYDSSRGASPSTWTPFDLSTRQENSPGTFPQLHQSSSKKGAQLVMKNVKRVIESPNLSPKWSKECLHKRELRRHMSKRADAIVDIHQKESVKHEMNHGRVLVSQSTRSPKNGDSKFLTRRILSPKSQMESPRREMVNGIRALSQTPNFTRKGKHILRPGSQNEDERRTKLLEKKESHWAPTSSWTTQRLSIKEIRQRSVSPKKIFDIRSELLQHNIQDQNKNSNLSACVNFGDSSRKTTSTSEKAQQPMEINSKENRHSLQEKKGDSDYKFEVMNLETTKIGERDPSSSESNLCGTRNSSPSPKHIFLRIPKSNTNYDKDTNTSTHLSDSQLREKPPISKKKSDRDMKLRVDIRSEFPLDIVDEQLKQFLKGVGGLIYYSPKDGGVPRIKELSDYFARKQPLLWFFPRST